MTLHQVQLLQMRTWLQQAAVSNHHVRCSLAAPAADCLHSLDHLISLNDLHRYKAIGGCCTAVPWVGDADPLLMHVDMGLLNNWSLTAAGHRQTAHLAEHHVLAVKP